VFLTVAAHTYEAGWPLFSDAWFDDQADKVVLSQCTSRPDLDEWWRENFKPHTGMWIHNHPERDRAQVLALRMRKLHGDGPLDFPDPKI